MKRRDSYGQGLKVKSDMSSSMVRITRAQECIIQVSVVCPDVVENSLHPSVKSNVMILLEESGELIRVLEFSQGLVDRVGYVQAPRKLSLLKEVLGSYRLSLLVHDLANKISHLRLQGLDPLVVTL